MKPDPGLAAAVQFWPGFYFPRILSSKSQYASHRLLVLSRDCSMSLKKMEGVGPHSLP